jgi:uncharacterized membrane protein
MDGRSLRLGKALVAGWEAIKRYPGLAIGGLALSQLVGASVSFVALVVLLPPWAGGTTVLKLSLVDGRDPKLEDLFAGFRTYGKWMGIYWLYQAIAVIAMLPLVYFGLIAWVALAVVAGRVPERLMFVLAGVISVAALALLAAAVAVMMRWAFVYYAGVESTGTLDAFRKSVEITKGHRLQLFWMLVVLCLIGFSGVIALVVGLLVTVPLSQCATAALYRQLQPLPPAPALPEAPAPQPPVVAA